MTVAGVDPFGGVKVFGGLALTLMWRIGVAHVAIAALDYGYQRWAHQRQLRMTKDEVRDEMRQAEGDPQIRARFRSLHRQYAMRRMMAAVPTADVVVTNPTHLAIALKYEAGSMKAPKVVAKGARLVAQRIREAGRPASRWSSTSRWPRRSTRRCRSAARSRAASIAPWPRSSPTCGHCTGGFARCGARPTSPSPSP